MSASSTSDSSSSTEQVSDVATSTQSVENAVSNEHDKFAKDLVMYFVLLAFFIFEVYYFLTMPEMGLLAGVVIIATVFPVLLKTCFYMGIITKMASEWLSPHIHAFLGK